MAIEQLIVTCVNPGEGIKKDESGYKVKACSAGLGRDMQDRLYHTCSKFGNLVYRNAPRFVLENELQWMRDHPNETKMPPEVLDAFPVLWSFDRVSDTAFALTRVRYIGFAKDTSGGRGRTGNFFAHALVLQDEDLQALEYNPFGLLRTDVFRLDENDAANQLPTIDGIRPNAPAPNGFEVMQNGVYRDSVGSIVSAICDPGAWGKPLIIGIAESRDAEPLLESLLSLIPPRARRGITFSIGDTVAGVTQGTGVQNRVNVVCTQDPSRPLTFNPNHINVKYTIFNFSGNQFSSVPNPRAFCAFPLESIQRGNADVVGPFLRLLDVLVPDGDPESWDRLADSHLDALFVDGGTPDALREALTTVCPRVSNASQASHVLNALMPSFASVAESGTNGAASQAHLEFLSKLSAKFEREEAITPALRVVVPAALRHAHDRGELDRVWHGSGTAAVDKFLRLATPHELDDLITRLGTRSAEQSYPFPDGLAILVWRRLNAGFEDSQAMFMLVELFADVIPETTEPKNWIQRCNEFFRPAPHGNGAWEKAVALGILAEEVANNELVISVLKTLDSTCRASFRANTVDALLNKLVAEGRLNAIAHTIWIGLTSDDPRAKPDAYQEWCMEYLERQTGAAGPFLRLLAEAIVRSPGLLRARWPLVAAMINLSRRKPDIRSGDGFVSLTEAMVREMSLDPKEDCEMHDATEPVPDGVGSEANAKLDARRYLNEAIELAQLKDYSLSELYRKMDDDLKASLNHLGTNEKFRVFQLLVMRCRFSGRLDAGAMHSILKDFGVSSDKRAEWILRVLNDADSITKILTLTGFADAAIYYAKKDDRAAEQLLVRVLEPLAKDIGTEFVRHLGRRFTAYEGQDLINRLQTVIQPHLSAEEAFGPGPDVEEGIPAIKHADDVTGSAAQHAKRKAPEKGASKRGFSIPIVRRLMGKK